MKSINRVTVLFLGGICVCALLQCNTKSEIQRNGFTQADSLTEVYLALQDSLHDTWSMMISDDNQKIKSMKALLHELSIGTPYSPEKIDTYNIRIDQLHRIRYTLKTMCNADVIEEYDFATASLVTELITMAESVSSFTYNTTIQKLVEDIRTSDMRVENYRAEYDSAAKAYNLFLERHESRLPEITDSPNPPAKRPLFTVGEQ